MQMITNELGAATAAKTTVIAINTGRNSQCAVKWAVDHLLKKNSNCILIHVRTKPLNSSRYSSPYLPFILPTSTKKKNEPFIINFNKTLFLSFHLDYHILTYDMMYGYNLNLNKTIYEYRIDNVYGIMQPIICIMKF